MKSTTKPLRKLSLNLPFNTKYKSIISIDIACILFLLMRSSQKICHRVQIKSEKDLEAFKRREERNLEGVARIILGKLENSTQEIWIDDIKNQPITRLKQSNNNERAHIYAKTIISACCGLSAYYGYFIINQNMIFFNAHKDIFAWINPDILENHIKIYLPHNHQGQLAMIRSIISFLKLWYKFDYSALSDIKTLNDLLGKFQQMKFKPIQGFKAKSPERQFLAARRNSVNMEGEINRRQAPKSPLHGQHLLMDNKSNKQACRSPMRQQSNLFLTTSLSNKYSNQLKFNHNQMTSETEKVNNDFEQKVTTDNKMMTSINKSIGIKSGNYFPNKTTSNKNHIVSLINKLDDGIGGHVKNKLLLDEDKMKELQKDKLKKMKESLDGIGEELNDLFVSNIENEQEHNEEDIKRLEQQFENLLG